MKFKDTQAIYLQIGEHLTERILSGQLREEEKIPSVRDLSAELQVNPNTVMRTYAYLQDKGIIYNQRGIGYFVTPGAEEEAKRMRREEFVEKVLPTVFRNLQLLGMSAEELVRRYEEYRKSSEKEARS